MRGGRMLGVICCAIAVAATGCGGDERSSAPQAAARPPPPAQTTATQTQPARPKPDLSDPNIDINTGRRLAPNPWKRPTHITPHPHADVRQLMVHDVKRGRGRASVRAYDWVFMDFIEATYATGNIFNYGWKHRRPFTTAGKILVPRDETRALLIGMRGMRVGGRRQIVVPAKISGGIEIDHPDYRTTTYWDVILRGFYARGCTPRGEPCRSGP